MDKIVVYAGTRNLYPVMEVAAKSLIAHNGADRVIFLTEDDTFPSPLPPCVSCMNVSWQHWFDSDGVNWNTPWTYMAYMRLALPKLLPDCNQVLYLDTDTLVLQDISELFDTDISDNLFAMVPEDIGEIPLELCHSFHVTHHTVHQFQSDSNRPDYPCRPYYNSGVMLMNLDKMRTDNVCNALIYMINTEKHPYPDQDIINLYCRAQIVPLPQCFNVISSLTPDFPFDQIKIKHFASDKPLWKSSLWQSYRRLTWDDVLRKQEALKNASK